MMQGLVVFLTLWLLLVLAYHGEGRLLPNKAFDMDHEESIEVVSVSTLKGIHHATIPKPVPCTWVCGEGGGHNYECNCIPNAPKANDLAKAKKTTIAHTKTPKSVPCTWVCGEGGSHNYECNCIPNAPKTDDLVEAEKTTVARAKTHKLVPCTWVCGEGGSHNYECNCIHNSPKKDRVIKAEKVNDSTSTAIHVGDVDKVGASKKAPFGEHN